MIDKILNPNTKVGDIFPNDVTQAKNIYRDLCKKYHPDTFVDDRANDIISALTKLYNNAIKAIEAGTWEKSNFIILISNQPEKRNENQDAVSLSIYICFDVDKWNSNPNGFYDNRKFRSN